MAEEPGFEDGKFLVRGARFEQALAKEMAVGAPEVLKPDDLVAGLAQGQGKKGAAAPGRNCTAASHRKSWVSRTVERA